MARPIKVLDIKAHKIHQELLKSLDIKRRVAQGSLGLCYIADIKELEDRVKRALDAAHPEHDKLIEAVDFANGRATAYTYDANDICNLAANAEARLARDGVTVANRAGTIVTGISGVPESKSYARAAHRAVATRVVLRRTTSGWVLVAIAKEERFAGPGGGEKVSTVISEAAKADIIRLAMSGYSVTLAPIASVATA